MTTEPDDDLVVRIVDVTLAAVRRAGVNFAPTIRSEVASVVRKEFSGDCVYIRKALGAQKEKRNERMFADRAAGLSVRAIARKHHVSKTRAGEILKGNTR